jgi:hypothetical protein
MTDARTHDDESLLLDLLLGQCSREQAEAIQKRLAENERLRLLHRDISNTLSAIKLLPEVEPPDSLVASTMSRIASARRTDALLAREGLARRDVIRPTFSLRELGTVAAVAVVLFGIFGLSYVEVQRRKDRNLCAAQVARLGSALLTYANKNDGYLPSTGTARIRWLPSTDQPAVSNSSSLFKLVLGDFAKPPTFQCPAVGGESFAIQSGMNDFPASKYVSYSYQHSLGPRGLWIEDKALSDVRKDMAILADSTPVFPHGLFRADKVRQAISENHGGTGQNILYLDMHVDFKRSPTVGVNGDNIYLAQGVDKYDGVEKPTTPTDTFLLPAFPESAEVPTEQPPQTPLPPQE